MECFCLFGRNFVLPVQNFVGGQIFFWKFLYLYHFLCTLGKSVSHTAQKTFRQSSQISIVRVQDKSLDEKFIWKKCFSTFPLTLSGKLTDFELNFPKHDLNEGHFTCPKNWKESNKNEKNYGFLLSLGFLSGKFMHFAQNRWGSVFKTAFYVPRKKLWRKLFSKKSISILLIGLWAERFRTLNENFLHVS